MYYASSGSSILLQPCNAPGRAYTNHIFVLQWTSNCPTHFGGLARRAAVLCNPRLWGGSGTGYGLSVAPLASTRFPCIMHHEEAPSSSRLAILLEEHTQITSLSCNGPAMARLILGRLARRSPVPCAPCLHCLNCMLSQGHMSPV